MKIDWLAVSSITGGGSQLVSIKQLFEYMTGLDARVGFPNEHLGKSKVDAIKSPMFATSVGSGALRIQSFGRPRQQILPWKILWSKNMTKGKSQQVAPTIS